MVTATGNVGKGRALIDGELYLSKSWIADRDRCREIAVPDEVEFATKAELAPPDAGQAIDAWVPASWVTANEAYGASVFGKDCGEFGDRDRREPFDVQVGMPYTVSGCAYLRGQLSHLADRIGFRQPGGRGCVELHRAGWRCLRQCSEADDERVGLLRNAVVDRPTGISHETIKEERWPTSCALLLTDVGALGESSADRFTLAI